MKKYLYIALLSSLAFGIAPDEYMLLLEKVAQTPAIVFEKEDFSWDKYSSAVTNQFVEGIKAGDELAKLSPAETIPLLFDLIENGQGAEKKTVTYFETRGYYTNFFSEEIYKQIRDQGGIHCGFSGMGKLAFPWLTKKYRGKDFNEYEIQYFWWVYGRKHLPKIWSNWYSCWYQEKSRPEPREAVINRLVADVSCLGFYAFPYLSQSLKEDDSLETVVEIFRYYSCFSIKGDFQTWWEANKDRYTFPEPKGWIHATRIINNGRLMASRSVKENMPVWHELAEVYYFGNINRYWYCFLPDKDEITEEDITEAICKAIEDK